MHTGRTVHVFWMERRRISVAAAACQVTTTAGRKICIHMMTVELAVHAYASDQVMANGNLFTTQLYSIYMMTHLGGFIFEANSTFATATSDRSLLLLPSFRYTRRKEKETTNQATTSPQWTPNQKCSMHAFPMMDTSNNVVPTKLACYW